MVLIGNDTAAGKSLDLFFAGQPDREAGTRKKGPGMDGMDRM
jgi:hypothetical protein